MSKFFLTLYDYFHTRKMVLYSLLAGSMLIFIFFAVQIKFEENVTSFFPDAKDHKNTSLVFKNLKVKDKIFVMFSAADTTKIADPDSLIDVCDRYIAGLTAAVGETHISSITAEIDSEMMNLVTNFIYDNLPVFLTDSDYERLDSLLQDDLLAGKMEANYNNLISPMGIAIKEVIKKDPLGIGTGMLSGLQDMGQSVSYQLYGGRIFSQDMSTLLVMIDPVFGTGSTGNNEVLIDAIETNIDEVQKESGDVKIEYFGGPSVGVYNARQIKDDTIVTATIALIIIVVFIAFAFRSRWAIILICVPVLYGAAFALSMIYLIVGSMSSIAIGAGVVVFGIAMSYSIHMLSHRNHTHSIRQIIQELAYPLTVGSFTTIGAFLGLLFTSSGLLRDFGLFAAFTMVGTTIFTLVFMPHLMKEQVEEKPNKLLILIEKINGYAYDRNKWVIGFIVLLTGVCFFTYNDVTFDSNMMNLSVQPEKLVRAEERLNTIFNSDNKVVLFASVDDNIDSALVQYQLVNKKIEELHQEGKVGRPTSAERFLIPSSLQKERIEKWNSFWSAAKKQQVEDNVSRAAEKVGFAPHSFDAFFAILTKNYTPIEYSNELLNESPLFKDWTTASDSVKMFLTKVSIDNESKEVIYKEFDSLKDLVILDRSHFANQMAVSVNNDFFLILYISSFLIFFALLLSYGRIELTIMTFAPMALSWVIILGLMAIFGLEFNIVNIILSTFIFGIGDDFSIFVMDGLLSEYRNGKKMLSSHKTAIFFSVFTTVVGMGALIFAQHPVLKSISVISILGMIAVVLISYTVQPFLFRLFISGQTKRGGFPFTLMGLLNSIYAFVYFILGCLVLQILILILLPLPISKRRKKSVFHSAVSFSTRFFLKTMITVKMINRNRYHETFEKPAVIISNHQSFIDILLLLGLNKKTIMVTNSWVWNSPFFGWIVRFADFYHTANGYEALADTLKEKVEDGYSILVFPEGTRSADCRLKHFHKGAFYLAQKLGLDILPIVQFGNGLISSKRQPFFIKKGLIVSDILQRIPSDDMSYQEKTKSVSKFFRKAYELLCLEYATTENPYYYDALMKNYTYKGPVLEWYMRIKVKMERNYRFFDELIPRDARIIDIGCGYAPLPFMLSLLSEKRVILGIDYDEEKIAVANHTFSKTSNLTFVCANVMEYDFPDADVFVLNDMLHYLSHEAQQELILRCIAKLTCGGMIIIRDGDQSNQKKHKVTKLTEELSTKIFKFNKTEGELCFTSAEIILSIAQKNGLSVEQKKNDQHTSNTIFILRHHE